MCIAMPYLIQSFFINDLSGVSRSVQQSLMNYMELYLTPSILATSIEAGNRLLETWGMEETSISSDHSNVGLIERDHHPVVLFDAGQWYD